MPYASGLFSRVYSWADDKANAIVITASRMDTEMDGMATGLSTCICRDGQSTTTAAIPFAVGAKFNDGSAATPAIYFTADTNTGLYRSGADELSVSCGGARVGFFGATTPLTVSKNQNDTTTLAVSNTDTTDSLSRAQLSVVAGTVAGRILAVHGSSISFGTTSAHDVFLTAGGATAVGIGQSQTIAIGGSASSSAALLLPAGTTAKSQIRFAASMAPSAPVNGDCWFDGADLKIRIGGTTRTVTVT